MIRSVGVAFSIVLLHFATAQDLPRVEATPLPGQQVSFSVDGEQRCAWHYGKQYPRPFFFPFCTQDSQSLTRMGHPGAENHDHHRSIWFAHHKVNGIDFWSDNTDAQIRWNMWYSISDGPDQAMYSFQLGWYDGQGKQIMQQDTVSVVSPDQTGDGTLLELQITLKPPPNGAPVTLQKPNFGILAVRVAKSITHHFGSGNLTDSEGRVGEKNIFGKAAQWMDYSGPVWTREKANRKAITAGITYFNHPNNPEHPVKWHVRSDGWMGASLCMDKDYQVTHEQPIVLRYLLHAHQGEYSKETAQPVFQHFSQSKGFEIRKSKRPHRQYETVRLGESPE